MNKLSIAITMLAGGFILLTGCGKQEPDYKLIADTLGVNEIQARALCTDDELWEQEYGQVMDINKICSTNKQEIADEYAKVLKEQYKNIGNNTSEIGQSIVDTVINEADKMGGN